MFGDVHHGAWSAPVQHVLQAGGWVAWTLVAVSLLFWFCLMQRVFALSPAAVVRFRDKALDATTAKGQALGQIDLLADQALRELSALRGVLRSLITAAPLMGLLGTVGGMIETFHSLGTARSTEATVAGGISTALITTQLGLMIGVVGLVATRVLERREARLARSIEAERARLADLVLRATGAST